MSTFAVSQPPVTQFSFGSVLRYYPERLLSVDEKRGRITTAPAVAYQLMQWVKSCNPALTHSLSNLLERTFDEKPELLSLFTGNRIVLVPVPRSKPISPSSAWPARWICEKILTPVLDKRRVTSSLAALLIRTSPIPPARTRKSDERRPSKQYGTLSVNRSQLKKHFPKSEAGDVVVLVDDIVTSGSTCMASAWHVKSRLPSVEVRAFALFRTVETKDPNVLIEPVAGTIKYYAKRDRCKRNP